MKVKTADGIKDVNLLQVTQENYIVPDDEKHLYHCRIEVRKFNPETGERLSKPSLQKFGRKFFERNGLHNLRQQGYTVDILYNPTEWIKANKELIAKKRTDVEAYKINLAKKALKAEIIEELRAAGLLKESDDAKEVKEADDAKEVKRGRPKKQETD